MFELVYQNQLKISLRFIHRVATEIKPLKIYSPSPLRHHQTPHVGSHILRGGTFLPFFCRTLLKKKPDTTDLDTVPYANESKPEGRLTRQHRLGERACRKLGGAGSSPKNTIIALDRAFPSLTDITL